MYGPVIQGSQFRLRPPRIEDAEVMIAWWEDMEVTTRLRRTFPLSLESEREWLKRTAEDRDQILWVIECEGRPVGTTGIHAIDWANQRGTTGTMIGDKTAWGKGIGGEVMRLRADFTFTQLPLRKLNSGYLEGNEASRRAQHSAGYCEVGRLHQEAFRDGRWLDFIVTELLRGDWERARRP